MFTGIITEVGRIKKVLSGSIIKVEIESTLHLRIGDSVAVDGVCLTLVDKKANSFVVEISRDTIGRTTLKAIKVRQKVNLEPPLKVGDYLSGHYVLGHVDTTTRITKKIKAGDEFLCSFAIPKGGGDYIIPLGSIAIDGISLTIKDLSRKEFNVIIIPETIRATTIGSKRVGDFVNCEYDIIARYIKKWTSRS